MKGYLLLPLVVGWMLSSGGAVSAQALDDRALLEEIHRLQKKVEELEPLKERLRQLERQLAEQEQEQAEALARAEETAQEEKPPEEENEEGIEFGGALRFNYSYKEWNDGSQDRGGDFDIDTFRLNVDGSLKKVLLSAEYRFYADGTEGIVGIDTETARVLGRTGSENYNFLHHGWFGYDFTETVQGQLGVTQVPFGILPYASHNWFFQLPYYVGLEDDYDAGLKLIWDPGPWDLQVAFFKSSEYGASNSERYSYDVVSDLGHHNDEANQGNIRLAYTFSHGDWGDTEIGLSGQLGQLYNSVTDSLGNHWAAGAHLNGTYGRWNLMLEFLRYQYNPDNPPGVDSRFVVMGAYDFPYRVASEADLWVGGLSYTLPVQWGPIDSLIFYDDYSLMDKDESTYQNTQMNVLGMAISGGPIFTYVDWAMGKNHPWLGPDFINGLAAGSADADWYTRFNINFGYYF